MKGNTNTTDLRVAEIEGDVEELIEWSKEKQITTAVGDMTKLNALWAINCYIKAGWCHVFLRYLQPKAATSYSKIITGLPKAKVQAYATFGSSNTTTQSAASGTMIYIEAGQTTLNGSFKTTDILFASLVYMVDES
jgi:hypothetical protein